MKVLNWTWPAGRTLTDYFLGRKKTYFSSNSKSEAANSVRTKSLPTSDLKAWDGKYTYLTILMISLTLWMNGCATLQTDKGPITKVNWAGSYHQIKGFCLGNSTATLAGVDAMLICRGAFH